MACPQIATEPPIRPSQAISPKSFTPRSTKNSWKHGAIFTTKNVKKPQATMATIIG